MIQGQGTTIKNLLAFFSYISVSMFFLPFFRELQLNKSIFQVAFFVLITPWSWSVHILEFRASNGDKYAHVVLRDILYKVYQKNVRIWDFSWMWAIEVSDFMQISTTDISVGTFSPTGVWGTRLHASTFFPFKSFQLSLAKQWITGELEVKHSYIILTSSGTS